MKVKPLTPAIGAEIFDLDVTSALRGDVFDALLHAFIQHHVLVIRDQQLKPADIVRFARHFGSVGAYPFAKPIDGHPEVIAIIKEPDQTSVFGGIWHTDSAYLKKPSMASVLYAVEVPAVGGDTLFSNQHAAFNALDDATKGRLRSLNAVHSSSKNQNKLRSDHLRSGSMQRHKREHFESSHPVVRQHPITGRESLYISPAHTTHIEGLSSEESDALLRELVDHALSDDFKCRVRWTPGTLGIWDNRCTLHYPVNDYHGQRREMWRVSIDANGDTLNR